MGATPPGATQGVVALPNELALYETGTQLPVAANLKVVSPTRREGHLKICSLFT
jgi:hypothetical protein